MPMTDTAAPAAWGTFLDPDDSLANVDDLATHLDVPIFSGHRARLDAFRGRNQIFDAIADRIRDTELRTEDQCSGRHYADLFECIRSQFGRVNRVVEVGVYLGGASTLIAGCAQPMQFDLDLVDIHPRFLRFAHERIRRTFPEAIGRVRMFLGDLPTYVHRVLLPDAACSALVHHDGDHHFVQVVKDLAALSFVRDKVVGVMIQDTHLRSRIRYASFVDAAVYAVFGNGVTFYPMGKTYPQGDPCLQPNRYQGNYFLPETPEGMFIPLEGNAFRYPHPSMTLEEFLPEREG